MKGDSIWFNDLPPMKAKGIKKPDSVHFMRIFPERHPMRDYLGGDLLKRMDCYNDIRNNTIGRQYSMKHTHFPIPGIYDDNINYNFVIKMLVCGGKAQSDWMEPINSGWDCYKLIHESIVKKNNKESMTYCRVPMVNHIIPAFLVLQMAHNWENDELRLYLLKGGELDLCTVAALVDHVYARKAIARVEWIVQKAISLKALYNLIEVFWWNNPDYNTRASLPPTKQRLDELPFHWTYMLNADRAVQAGGGSFMYKDKDDPNAEDVDKHDRDIEFEQMGLYKYVMCCIVLYIVLLLCVVLYIVVLCCVLYVLLMVLLVYRKRKLKEELMNKGPVGCLMMEDINYSPKRLFTNMKKFMDLSHDYILVI